MQWYTVSTCLPHPPGSRQIVKPRYSAAHLTVTYSINTVGFFFLPNMKEGSILYIKYNIIWRCNDDEEYLYPNYSLTEPSWIFALIDPEIDSYLYLSPFECSNLNSLAWKWHFSFYLPTTVSLTANTLIKKFIFLIAAIQEPSRMMRKIDPMLPSLRPGLLHWLILWPGRVAVFQVSPLSGL